MTDPLEKAVLDAISQNDNQDPEDRNELRRSQSTLSNPSSAKSEEDSDVDEHTGAAPALQPTLSTGSTRQTGPKGVLADYNASKEAQRLQDRQGKGSQKPSTATSKDSDDDSDIGEDDAAMLAYTQQRLRDMRLAPDPRGVPVGSKRFGHLREIGAASFDRAVLQEEAHIKVILHIYEAVSLYGIGRHQALMCWYSLGYHSVPLLDPSSHRAGSRISSTQVSSYLGHRPRLCSRDS